MSDISTIYEKEMEAVVKAGIFESKEDLIQEAINTLFAVKPVLRLEASIQLYKESKVTLGRAAEIAGVTRWRFQEILSDRGIQVVIEADSPDELDKQIHQVKEVKG